MTPLRLTVSSLDLTGEKRCCTRFIPNLFRKYCISFGIVASDFLLANYPCTLELLLDLAKICNYYLHGIAL